jgi:hypothetical protein
MKKLPREVKEGDDAIRPDDPAWLAEMMETVGPLLMNRLSARRPDP